MLFLHRQLIAFALLPFGFLVVRCVPVFAADHRRDALSMRWLLWILIANEDLVFSVLRLGLIRMNVLVILCLVCGNAIAQAFVASGALLIPQLS